MSAARTLSFVCASMALLFAGCSSKPAIDPRPAPPPKPLASYQTLADAHNERVARLDRLWSRMSFVVRRPDPDNPSNTLSDQAEGHIQIQQPSEISVSMTKLGELFFLLGSNEQLYWWIDRSDKRDPAVLFGRHELAGPRTLEWLGVSIAPLELVDLFGITPLPEATEEYDAWVRRDREGMTAAIVPTRFGYRKLLFDPESRELLYVELLDAAGEVAVSAELGRTRRVPVEGEGMPGEFMGTRIRLTVPAEDVFISIELAEQANREVNSNAFDFDRLMRSYGRNGRVYDLDLPPEVESPQVEPDESES